MACDGCNFFIFHFVLFFILTSWKIKSFKKMKKNAWRYHHFTHLYQKLWSHDVWFLRYGARRMEGNSDIERWVPHLKILSDTKWFLRVIPKNTFANLSKPIHSAFIIPVSCDPLKLWKLCKEGKNRKLNISRTKRTFLWKKSKEPFFIIFEMLSFGKIIKIKDTRFNLKISLQPKSKKMNILLVQIRMLQSRHLNVLWQFSILEPQLYRKQDFSIFFSKQQENIKKSRLVDNLFRELCYSKLSGFTEHWPSG